MDERLVRWGRAVKRRTRNALPVLWLFSDEQRGGDLVDAVGRLPKGGLCGVVFRHDGAAGRAALLARVAAVCRARRVALVVAGGSRRFGVHVRGGRKVDGLRAAKSRANPSCVTSSAHNVVEVRRAAKAGVDIVFISPVFATASHPGAKALGVMGWNRLARHRGRALAYVLGGISGETVKRLADSCCGAGGISGFL